MKKYEEPVVKVITFMVEDIITTSNLTGGEADAENGGGGNLLD